MTRFVGTPVKGVEFANAGDEAISARVSGDSNARIRIDAGGRLTWGDGATAGDANLYRSDANTLKTDDTLYAVNGVITLTTVGAPTANLPDGAIAIDTSADSLYLRSQSAWVKAGGVELSTTAPTANVSDGDMWFDTDDGFLYVRNSGSWVSVTATLALNGISDVTITSATTGDFLTWNGTAWVNGAGDVAFNSVTLGSAPTQASHAATKSYVDNLAAGIDWHEAARLGTTSALPNAPTYGNGSSGEGATLTAGTQNRLVVDGANANTGDRILVKTQAVGYEDGVYSVTNQGASGSAAWVLTRADDFDGTQPGGIQPGEAVFVLNGSVNANQGFVVTSTNDPHTVGTDSITFTQFTGAQAFSAGAGLTKTGNTIDVVTADSGRIVVSADSVDLGSVSVGATSGSATQSFVSSVATDAYGRVTGVETSSLIQGLGTADSPSFTAVTSDVTGTVSDISNHNLNGISDVTIASAATGEFLKWNGTAWVNAAITGVTGIAALNDIGDVTIASATSGEILFWNGTAWVNDTIASVNQIDDVTITSAISGNILTHNGTNWINSPFTIQNAGGVSVSGETSGDVLLFNGSNYVNTAHTLANITNVTLTTEANGEFLKYNGSAWINASIPEINTLNDVGNVAITSATSGDVLKWSGTQWINSDILASPGLTGVPTAATASTTTSTTQIATTAFVQQELAALVESAPATLDTLNELAAALGDDANFSTTVTNSLALKAPLESPTFTGTVTLPAGTSFLHDYDAYGASHTLVVGNGGQTLEFSATGTLTVPPDATVNFTIGTQVMAIQTGNGNVTVAGGAGVTINYAVGLKTRKQWSAIVLHKRAANTWLMTGDAKV